MWHHVGPLPGQYPPTPARNWLRIIKDICSSKKSTRKYVHFYVRSRPQKQTYLTKTKQVAASTQVGREKIIRQRSDLAGKTSETCRMLVGLIDVSLTKLFKSFFRKKNSELFLRFLPCAKVRRKAQRIPEKPSTIGASIVQKQNSFSVAGNSLNSTL